VPVAINYDRVLEDRVLMAAKKRGDRRFGARISVVLGFILQKLWLRLRGRFLRFGSAGVVFGEPLSMGQFGLERPVEDLAETLMTRIEAAMPHMCVPLLAQIMLATEGTMKTIDLTANALAQIENNPKQYLMKDAEAPEERITRGLEHMIQRGFIERNGDTIEIVADERDSLHYYANSLGQDQGEISAAAQ